MPDLETAIGLPWPVDRELGISEVSSTQIEGYAGLYDSATDEIQISEDLDEQIIVHETAHAWFNGGLFAQRWISEGLADEYASRVIAAEGRTGRRARHRLQPRQGGLPPQRLAAAVPRRCDDDGVRDVRLRRVVDGHPVDRRRRRRGEDA